jgi:hypothetical protein
MKTNYLCLALLAMGCEEPKKIVPMTISQPAPTSYVLEEAETKDQKTYYLPEFELNNDYLDL